jgi:hypothetical protein
MPLPQSQAIMERLKKLENAHKRATAVPDSLPINKPYEHHLDMVVDKVRHPVKDNRVS